LKWITVNGELDLGTATNFVPRNGPPTLANFTGGNVRSTVRPLNGLTIENSYLVTRLLDQQTHLNIFNNHIFRSKWNYQFTKEFSLRLIGQYTTTISNPGLTTLQNTKRFNLQNLDPTLSQTPDGLLRTRKSFINDGRQVFIKLSYLFRY
jgi:hypothetical protein